MVRWIQVGHEDLLHRSEGKSGVSNSPLRFLRKRVNQGDSLVIILDSRRTRLARRHLQSQSILPPTASEFTPRLLIRNPTEERVRSCRENHKDDFAGWRESWRRWRRRRSQAPPRGKRIRIVNVRDGPLRFGTFGLGSRLVLHQTAPLCSAFAQSPVHRYRKEAEIDFARCSVQAQTAPSCFASVRYLFLQFLLVQKTFLSGQELRIARACSGFAQFLAHRYQPVQTRDPERSCRFRLAR